MKVRTAEELADLLEGNLKRRKRELTTFRFLVERVRAAHERPALLRTAVPMLYSHWEGFVKYAANAYIALVDHQALPYSALTPGLVGLALRPAFLEAQQSPNSHGARTRLMATLIQRSSEQARLRTIDESAVSTSNLNSKVFFDLLQLLDIASASYSSKQVLIDQKLLKKRNEIAHGELLEVEPSDYDQLHTAVLELLEQFSNDIINAAVMRRYLRAVSPAA